MIFNWIRKKILVSRGLSCGKSRRLPGEPVWRQWLRCSPLVRILIFLTTFLLLVRIGTWHSDASLYEICVLAAMVVTLACIIIHVALRDVWEDNHLVLLMLGVTVLNLLLNKYLIIHSGEWQVLETSIPALLIPCALAPMLASILISPFSGFITAFLVALLGNLFLDPSPGLFLSSLLTGFGAAYLSQRIRRRSDLIMAGLGVSIIGLVCALLIGWLIDPSLSFLVVQGVWAITLGVLTALLVSAILPVFEWLFDRITDISWLELSDLNHPILKRLAAEAPGTYHHSLNVANLSEAAALAIGANATQCRVSSYFHDIGKLVKPQYFVENYRGEGDPHAQLNPNMSALIIIAHVKEGVNLALQHHLRQPIIDAIREHHGTSMVYFFYRRALQMKDDAIAGGKILKLREEDIPDVEERTFRYGGPIPQSRETAIISLADSVESASRSIKQPTTQKIESMVKEIVENRVEDGQLDESQLTFNELSTITQTFINTLKNMLHARIEYPKEKREKESRPAEKESARLPAPSGSGENPKPPDSSPPSAPHPA